MSVSGISSSNLSTYGTSGSGQSNFQQIQKEFQQLGQDLQSGNLSAAQSDFVTLTKLVPKLASAVASSSSASASSTSSSSQSANPLLQNFSQLAQDLQSGNLSAAQSDYTNIQQDFQHFSPQSGGPQGHHHHSGNGDVGNGLQTTGTSSDSTVSVNV